MLPALHSVFTLRLMHYDQRYCVTTLPMLMTQGSPHSPQNLHKRLPSKANEFGGKLPSFWLAGPVIWAGGGGQEEFDFA